jgi:hypothetical protein
MVFRSDNTQVVGQIGAAGKDGYFGLAGAMLLALGCFAMI